MVEGLEGLKRAVVASDREPLRTLLAERYGIELPDREESTFTGGLKPTSNRLQPRDFSFRDLAILASINRDPCLGQSERVQVLEGLGINSRQMSERKSKLLEQGLIQEFDLAPPGGGKPSHYHALTEAGRQVIKQMGEPVTRIHGSLNHHCRMRWLAAHYRDQGYTTALDRSFGDVRPDILCRHPQTGETGMVEVVLSQNLQDELNKVIRASAHVDWIHLHCQTEKMRRHFERSFRMEVPGLGPKLHFFTIT